MRALVSFFLTLGVFAALPAATGKAGLPPEVHPTFATTLDTAESAYRHGEVHKALAMLKGLVYPKGVTVKIDAHAAGSKADTLQSALKRSIDTWQRHLDGDSPLVLMQPHQKAEVNVVFTAKIPDATPDALGLIDLKKEYRWNKSRHEVEVSGTIYVLDTWNGRALTQVEMIEVLTHELGHLLGLADVPGHGVLMGPMMMGKPILEPKPHERIAVLSMRSKSRQLIREFSLTALSQPQNDNFSNEKLQTSYSHRIDLCTCKEYHP